MSESVPLCTHIKTDGVRCGSPAVSGTALCYHHSVVKTTLDKVPARSGAAAGQFEPIPFLFAEDRASMQINYFLLLSAFNEHRVDLRNFKAMMSILKAMGANLGKSGSLIESSVQRSAVKAQEGRDQRPGTGDQEGAAREVSVALNAAAEKRGKAARAEAFSLAPDYGFLPSVLPSNPVMPWEVGAGSDPVKEMAKKAARVRW